MRPNFILTVAALCSVLLLAGCRKHPQPYTPGGNDPGDPGGKDQPEQQVTLKQRTDWSVKYLGRDWWNNDDGTRDRVEKFEFVYTANNWFIIRSITPGDLQDIYGSGDSGILAFFKDQAAFVVDQAGTGHFYDDTDNVFNAGTKGVCFDLLLHGTWNTYMIEMDKDGSVTGNYCLARHDVLEEAPTESFQSWLGTWRIGNSNLAYEITVSSAENNYLYYIDGWETGVGASEQMNLADDWFYARHLESGDLAFYNQYRITYKDDDLSTDNQDVYVDQMFIGFYMDSQGIVADNEEGWNIAHTVKNGGKVTIEPYTIYFDNGFEPKYKKMQWAYFYWDPSDSNSLVWDLYNPNVPTLPMSFDKIAESKSVSMAPVERKVTKATLLRNQPRAHRARAARSANTARVLR